MMISRHHVNLAVRKAKKSSCHCKVSAIAWNYKGDLIMTAVNRPRFSKEGGGVHAEMLIMRKKPMAKTILICRINNGGEIRPLHPCAACAEKAKELGIRIISVKEDP
jgi:cytidine deaminase